MFASGKTSAASTGGYQISRSLRFNDADTAYLTRTPASASNRKTWTWSAWIKRGKIDRYERYTLFASRPTANPYTLFYFSGGAQPNQYGLRFEDPSADLQTTQVFRDVSAWYHIVLAVDTTQATASNRIKMYVNGSQITVFTAASYPTQNTDMSINNTTEQCIGSNTYLASTEDFDGYMTEINFVDGTQLTPSSFGETNAQTGVWQPKAYSGSYGTNGFYLNFSDNSNTTAATLGKDYSGNGNNWTPNNFSVTAGAGNDSLVDSPTSYGVDTGVGGTVRGNYCTMNPLSNSGTLTNGNLNFVANAGASSKSIFATTGVSSGKWYWEMTVTTTGNSYYPGLGIETNTAASPDVQSGDSATGYMYLASGQKYNNGTLVSVGGGSFSNGDVIGVALDMDGGTIAVYKNNTSIGQLYSGITGTARPVVVGSGSTAGTMNFGQRPFAYTAPSGFKALCTQNLPTPTIGATTATQAGKFFNAVLYTGNNSTQSITGVGFQPDLVWAKSRSNAFWHTLIDAVRGRAFILASNTTNADIGPEPSDKELTAFTSDGFNLGPDYNLSINSSGATFVAWNWKANGSGSTNTAGSITSTVSANTTSGFSVVTYTGTGATGTVGHGLGVAPSMYIIKKRSAVDPWTVWFTGFTVNEYIVLNSTGAKATYAGQWSALPTSTVLGLSNENDTNESGATFVAYCFAEVAGYSKIGTYTGNGSADGPFIYTGFRPAYVMVKPSSAAGAWWINDNKRDTYNVNDHRINANTSDAEATSGFTQQDFLSNGFKWRNSDSAWNGSGVTYIYMAFAENPFKYSLAR